MARKHRRSMPILAKPACKYARLSLVYHTSSPDARDNTGDAHRQTAIYIVYTIRHCFQPCDRSLKVVICSVASPSASSGRHIALLTSRDMTDDRRHLARAHWHRNSCIASARHHDICVCIKCRLVKIYMLQLVVVSY